MCKQLSILYLPSYPFICSSTIHPFIHHSNHLYCPYLPSISLFIYPFILPSTIYPSYLSIHVTHPSFYLSTHPPIIHSLIHQFAYSSTWLFTYLPSCPFAHPSIHPSPQTFIHPSTYPHPSIHHLLNTYSVKGWEHRMKKT